MRWNGQLPKTVEVVDATAIIRINASNEKDIQQRIDRRRDEVTRAIGQFLKPIMYNQSNVTLHYVLYHGYTYMHHKAIRERDEVEVNLFPNCLLTQRWHPHTYHSGGWTEVPEDEWMLLRGITGEGRGIRNAPRRVPGATEEFTQK
jgi:hypothetical protein